MCGWLGLVLYDSQEVGAPSWPPGCFAPDCNGVMERAPQPGDFGFDLKTDGEGGKGFQKFTVHRLQPTCDGLVQVEETIDSVHKVRQLEKESEQRYRDGEGEPLRFRAWNQDASNRDVNSFGTEGQIGDRHSDSGRAPQKKSNVEVKRHGQQKPKIPIARRGGGSPLKGY